MRHGPQAAGRAGWPVSVRGSNRSSKDCLNKFRDTLTWYFAVNVYFEHAVMRLFESTATGFGLRSTPDSSNSSAIEHNDYQVVFTYSVSTLRGCGVHTLHSTHTGPLK